MGWLGTTGELPLIGSSVGLHGLARNHRRTSANWLQCGTAGLARRTAANQPAGSGRVYCTARSHKRTEVASLGDW